MLDDGYMRYEMIWTDWRERFAFFPKRIVTKDYVTVGELSYRTDIKTRWIWLKRYWERYRADLYWRDGQPAIEYDYALNIFELLKKS